MSNWTRHAINEINADFQRSAETHLIRFRLADYPGICFYLKDESTHLSGSLKHRLARSLFLYGLANGWIKENTPIIEASSGSTAVSEAYFAQLLGIAVMPATTAKRKIEQIQFYGGQCHFVTDPCELYSASAQLAHKLNGHFMDQFTYAEHATDWRGNNNIAESIFRQMAHELFPVPHTLIMSAGTGGTSATLGRYIRYQGVDTQLLVVDPEHSVFFDYWHSRDVTLCSPRGSLIEGIGRPRVEPSFMSDVIDETMKVPDGATLAAMLKLKLKLKLAQIIGRKPGASTGTNFWGMMQVAKRMVRKANRVRWSR